MIDFEFIYPTRMIVGRNKYKDVGRIIKQAGAKKVLVHFGGGSIVKSGLLSLIETSLSDAGLEYVELGGVVSNPRLDMVETGVRVCRENNIDFILACGGGSVIDSSKAIAACVEISGDVWKFLKSYGQAEHALPVGVVLTIPGTGSESGSAAVITNPSVKEKFLYAAENTYPVFCIIDPQLYIAIPEKIRWPGLCDMLSHAMERYFSPTEDAELSGRITESIMCTLINNICKLRDGENTYEVWCELAVAGNVAHNGFTGIGRIADWACHLIEHEMSAYYDIAHGRGLTVITPAWMKYVYRENIPLFERFGRCVMGVDSKTAEPEQAALEGILRLENLFKSLGMPTCMEEVGITDRHYYSAMASAATENGSVGQLKKLSSDDVINIFILAERNCSDGN